MLVDMKKVFLFLAFIFIGTLSVNAQTGSASWRVLRYDINVTLPQNERKANIRAVLSLRNVDSKALTTVSLRIAPSAEIVSAKVNDTEASVRTSTESAVGKLLRAVVTIPSVASGSTVNVALEYRFNVASNTGYASLSQLESSLLSLLNPPSSIWYPQPNNPFLPSGNDIAPFRLSVTTANGEQVISSGKSSSNVYDQPLNGNPFFVTGNWEIVEGAGDAKGISSYLPKGSSAEEKKQAENLIVLTSAARSFYAGILGQTPDVPVRLVAVSRGAGFADNGTMLVNEAAFRRGKIDLATASLIADSLPRLWLGGSTAIRGEGYGALREGISKYLALLFWEKQFGVESANVERRRERLTHANIAKKDSPVSQTTIADENYYTVTANKGAMVWRLVEKTMGKDAFLAFLRSEIQKGGGDANGLMLSSFRSSLLVAAPSDLKSVLDSMLDQPSDLDLLVGLPQQKGGVWSAALRNLGAIDVTVNVTATTQNGEKITTQAAVPAKSFGEAVFKTSSPIVRTEVDPEKLYAQSDYSNDISPRPKVGDNALNDARAAFNKQDYVQAESIGRQIVQQIPLEDDARTLLGRILLAQNKLDEAEKEFNTVLNATAVSAQNQAWANAGLGEIKLRKNQTAEAIKFFNAAIRVDGEYGATLAARAGRIKAESNAPPAVDETAKAFIAQIDKIIISERKSDLNTVIVSGEMSKFVSGIIGNQPEIWQTKVLRTEMVDSVHMAVDVSLNIKALNTNQQAGTAVYILAKVGGGWKLAAIEYFEVR